MASMAVVIAIGLCVTHPTKAPVSAPSDDGAIFYLVPGEIQGYTIPRSFQVLAGYPEAYDASAIHHSMIGMSTEEESL